MLAQFYEEDLGKSKEKMELVERGAVATASGLILNNLETASNDTLTLKDVCYIADELNRVLRVVESARRDISHLEKLLAEARENEAKTQIPTVAKQKE